MFDYRRVGCNSEAFNEVWEPLRTSILATYLPDLGRIILCLILHGFRLEVHVVGLSHHSAPVEVGKPRWTLSSLQMHSDRGKSVRMYLYIYIYNYIYTYPAKVELSQFWVLTNKQCSNWSFSSLWAKNPVEEPATAPTTVIASSKGGDSNNCGRRSPPLLWVFTHPTVDLRFSHKSNH